MKCVLKGGISIDADSGLLGMYFDAAVVFFKKTSVLFRLALAILWSKYKLRIFSKKTHNISKIIFYLGFYEHLESLESKIRRCPFFGYS